MWRTVSRTFPRGGPRVRFSGEGGLGEKVGGGVLVAVAAGDGEVKWELGGLGGDQRGGIREKKR